MTIALLAIVCMLIACFPTAALILIKKYIWVRIWIAKCDLRPLDFAEKCPQEMQEIPFPRTKFQKFAGGACPRTPLEICRHFGHVLYGAKSQLASPAEQKPARHWMCVIIDEIKYSKLNCNLSWILLEANSRHTMTPIIHHGTGFSTNHHLAHLT